MRAALRRRHAIREADDLDVEHAQALEAGTDRLIAVILARVLIGAVVIAVVVELAGR